MVAHQMVSRVSPGRVSVFLSSELLFKCFIDKEEKEQEVKLRRGRTKARLTALRSPQQAVLGNGKSRWSF